MIPNNINKQLAMLVREGVPIEDACRSLNIDVDAGALALQSLNNPTRAITVDKLIEDFKPEAINILMEIARHGEKDSDRVKACQLLVEGKGVLPDINASQFSSALERMKQAIARETPLIEV